MAVFLVPVSENAITFSEAGGFYDRRAHRNLDPLTHFPQSKNSGHMPLPYEVPLFLADETYRAHASKLDLSPEVDDHNIVEVIMPIEVRVSVERRQHIDF